MDNNAYRILTMPLSQMSAEQFQEYNALTHRMRIKADDQACEALAKDAALRGVVPTTEAVLSELFRRSSHVIAGGISHPRAFRFLEEWVNAAMDDYILECNLGETSSLTALAPDAAQFSGMGCYRKRELVSSLRSANMIYIQGRRGSIASVRLVDSITFLKCEFINPLADA